MSNHWRLQLNNVLQRSYGTRALDWTDSHYGPEHAGYWESVVYIRGVEYGRGKGATQSEAREVAAQHAYNHLLSYRLLETFCRTLVSATRTFLSLQHTN
ncbi:hypothetical protein C8Q75DRAFT_444198 [Abortiporus biennis]|nr:hypothetical protein C8Q75DRAFT_444198 [Abortiporus biennis]